jgi:hypothetical protein
MPSRLSVAALAALAPLSLAACEKQNPFITMTAGGIVVKARATRYCRGDDCRVTTDNPRLKIRSGDTLGVDVPRSVAHDGWRLQIGDNDAIPLNKDHYRALPLGQFDSTAEPVVVRVLRDGPDAGEWQFTLVPHE